jgi:hypothetical protein
MGSFLKSVAADRIRGKRPGPHRAIGAAIAVGGAAGVVTYRLLRQGS